MKRPTQVDVAKKAGVSRATVSYVINGSNNSRVPISPETQQRVLEAITELGYEPDASAQALRSGNTKTIALIIPDLRNPHFAEYAIGIEQEARAAGYHVLISSINLQDEYAINMFKDLFRHRIDGMILVSSFILKSEEPQLILAQLQGHKLPIVELNDLYDFDSVSSDYREATKEVMSYLFSLHHHRIGLVYGVYAHDLAEDRLQPYIDSLNANNLPIDHELLVECGPTIEDGYQAAAKLLQLPSRPTAIIAINDLLAFGAVRAAIDLGLKVPDDLSVVGYDDITMSNYMAPRLTTVTKDALKLGRKAFSILLTRIKNPDIPRQKYFLPAKLIIRESTGTAPF